MGWTAKPGGMISVPRPQGIRVKSNYARIKNLGKVIKGFCVALRESWLISLDCRIGSDVPTGKRRICPYPAPFFLDESMLKSVIASMLFLVFGLACGSALAQEATAAKKIVILAGKPSHPPRMHEFRAGSMLLQDCLQDSSQVDVTVVENGWPKDESVFKDAAAIIFFMDGGGGHEVVKENGRRKQLIDEMASDGVGLGFMHFGVEVVADQAGAEFKDWIGGHYEHMFSCNPIWEPVFDEFPDHPICNGVKPFKIKDEWYMNMRFVADIAGNEATEVEGLKFQPILVASPSDEVRDGPYVYPRGPYPHIQANKGRAEAMMWCVERPDGGRGFGFTGGHFHDNWADDNFRKVVLNALLWTAKVPVPESGVASTVSEEQMDQNLDKK